MSKPKLLMLTSSFPRCEADQTCDYIRQLAVSLSAEYDVTVLTPASQGTPSTEETRGLGVRRFNYFLPRRAQVLDSARDAMQTLAQSYLGRVALIFYLLFFFWHAWRLGKRADVIVSHWLVPAGLIGAVVSRLCGKPHVVIEHSGALRLLKRLPGGRWLTRFIVTESHRVITVSQELRQRLIEWCPTSAAKTSVISMGVDVAAFSCGQWSVVSGQWSDTSDQRPIVLYLGRLAEVKGVSTLIQAMVDIKDAVLVIAGGGECERELKQLATRLNVHAVFLGSVDQKQKLDWLRRCQVVVVPSVVLTNGKTEGLPVVCLEAFAAGKPVIASHVGGLPEVVRDGQNGFLIEPANVTELRDKLSLLLKNEWLRMAMGACARRTAQQYDWALIGKRFAEVIRDARHDAARRSRRFHQTPNAKYRIPTSSD
jgi:glycosyltransferase involved in cell wall biosynthesis